MLLLDCCCFICCCCFFFVIFRSFRGKKTTRTDIIININNTKHIHTQKMHERALFVRKQCRKISLMLDTHPLFFLFSLSLSLCLSRCEIIIASQFFILFFFCTWCFCCCLTLQLHTIKFSSPVSLIVGRWSYNATENIAVFFLFPDERFKCSRSYVYLLVILSLLLFLDFSLSFLSFFPSSSSFCFFLTHFKNSGVRNPIRMCCSFLFPSL